MDSKAKLQSLVDTLHKSRATPEVETVLRMLAHMVEDGKNKLLVCTPDDFIRAQAEVMTYRKIMNLILRPSLPNRPSTE